MADEEGAAMIQAQDIVQDGDTVMVVGQDRNAAKVRHIVLHHLMIVRRLSLPVALHSLALVVAFARALDE